MTTVDGPLLERVARERRFDPRTLEIARKLFINDEAVRKVAQEYGVIDKRVYAIRKTVLDHVQKYELPQGWSEVTLRGPAELVQAVHELFEQMKTDLLERATDSGR